MTWHEHLGKLPHKGEITVVTIPTSIIGTVSDNVSVWQPIIASAAGIIGCISGALLIWEWFSSRDSKKEKARLEIEKLTLEIENEKEKDI
jgi:hypothetical protein